jgi:large subunit ribosomal protein L9|tara:strand:+ start:581 stop:1219 length:639 start_codon:yes stop_codon:yes gene_type:complete
MKVIFVKDVPGSGNAGDVKEVKNGYGRNYLLPKSFALLASHDNLQRLNSIKKAGDEQRIKEEQDQNELAKLLNDMEFELSEKVNSSGKFYGSVNNTMISEKIESETERSLDRRLFVIENPIEEPGIYTIGINFPRGAECSIKIKVSGIDIQGNIVEVQEISEQEIIETTGNLDITEDIVELSDSETTNEPVSEESSSSPQSEVKEDNNEEIA